MAEGSDYSSERIRLPQKPKLSERVGLKLPVRPANTGKSRIKLPSQPVSKESSLRFKLPSRSPEDVLKELAGVSQSEQSSNVRNLVGEGSKEGEESARLRLHVRERAHGNSFINDAGNDFWDKLSPSRREILERPLREAEEWLAQHFPDGYVSPMVGRAQAIRGRDELEKQRDMTSCTFVSLANALRLLDKPRTEYSKSNLEGILHTLTNLSYDSITDPNHYRQLFSMEYPLNQFDFNRISGANEVDRPRNMLQVLQAFSRGDAAISYWDFIPHESGVRRDGHARTIVGFEKGPNNTLSFIAIDPFGARLQRWAFRDWIVASRWQNTFNSPDFDDESLKGYFKDARMCNYIAGGVNIIHKKAA